MHNALAWNAHEIQLQSLGVGRRWSMYLLIYASLTANKLDANALCSPRQRRREPGERNSYTI